MAHDVEGYAAWGAQQGLQGRVNKLWMHAHLAGVVAVGAAGLTMLAAAVAADPSTAAAAASDRAVALAMSAAVAAPAAAAVGWTRLGVGEVAQAVPSLAAWLGRSGPWSDLRCACCQVRQQSPLHALRIAEWQAPCAVASVALLLLVQIRPTRQGSRCSCEESKLGCKV
jgi:hypothetical protein